MPKAVLFDLDDTITDRRASLVEYANFFQADFHQDLVGSGWTDVHSVITEADGLGYAAREDVFRALQGQLAWRRAPDLLRLAQHWEHSFPRATSLRQGVLETMLELRQRGFLLGLVTNGRAWLQRSKIDHLGIAPLLSCIVVSEEVGYEKPRAQAFNRALSDLDCACGEAWFVGDHPRNDILGALAAGLRAVWLSGIHQWPIDEPFPECSVDAIQDLLPLIGQP